LHSLSIPCQVAGGHLRAQLVAFELPCDRKMWRTRIAVRVARLLDCQRRVNGRKVYRPSSLPVSASNCGRSSSAAVRPNGSTPPPRISSRARSNASRADRAGGPASVAPGRNGFRRLRSSSSRLIPAAARRTTALQRVLPQRASLLIAHWGRRGLSKDGRLGRMTRPLGNVGGVPRRARGEMAGFGLERWPLSNRNPDPPQIETVAVVRSERADAFVWNL
jgi:hypothetical protein